MDFTNDSSGVLVNYGGIWEPLPQPTSPPRTEQEYLARLSALASERKGLEGVPEALLQDRKHGKPRAFYVDQRSYCSITTYKKEEIIAAVETKINQYYAVCVVENISVEWMIAFGCAWNIDPAFFLDYVTNPAKENLWTEPAPRFSPSGRDFEHHWHADGIFEYEGWEKRPGERLDSIVNDIRRHCFEDPPYPMQSNTRISCCCPSSKRSLSLILVDAPLNLSAACVRRQQRRSPTLRFLYASNTGGLVLPQLLSEPTYSLFESLRTVFGYSWHLALLFYSPRNKYSKGGILPPHAFLYMCAASIWATNLRFLDRDIKRISFEDIRHPSLKVNDRLHDRREDLIRLKAALLETNRHVPPNLDEFLERFPHLTNKTEARWFSPIIHLQETLEEAEKLEVFLMDTFQLLMSSMSVLDSRTSIEQAQRGQQLTQLAFVYIPLSFITGVFGMNVKEINGSPLSIWVTVMALLVALALTAIVSWLYGLYDRRSRRQRVKDPSSEPE